MNTEEALHELNAKALFKLPKPTASERFRTVPPYTFEAIKRIVLEQDKKVERYCWVVLNPNGERNMGILWMETCYLPEGLHTADTFATLLENCTQTNTP